MAVLTIKEVCERYQISQSALARRFGIPLRTVQDWHGSRRTPPEYVVRMIAEILDREAEDDKFCSALVEEIRNTWPDKSSEEIRAEVDAYKARKEAFMGAARKRLKDK